MRSFELKSLVMLLVLLLLAIPVFAVDDGDHEYAPIGEKAIEYKNWNYKNVMTDEEVSLRDFAKDKKLVQVFYFAHWCHSTNYQAPITQKYYEKYKDDGFAVIGVSMYGNLEQTQNKVRWWRFSFPVVGETFSSRKRTKSLHYKYRTATGDNRKWATPWNIFLEPSKFEEKGDMLVDKAFVANGELREGPYEDFLREKLGLPALERKKAVNSE
ncbi:MAG: redoxin domain-containing protein [Pyrinomonadaceae bacterium]|nr:redoxin domain-containing protein [Pyrinomonadaceae bacterium]